MSVGLCSICGKFTKAGGLCYEHSKAMHIYNEEQKWEIEDEEQFKDKHRD